MNTHKYFPGTIFKVKNHYYKIQNVNTTEYRNMPIYSCIRCRINGSEYKKYKPMSFFSHYIDDCRDGSVEMAWIYLNPDLEEYYPKKVIQKNLERICNLNPNAGEIGEGMLRTIILEAKESLELLQKI